MITYRPGDMCIFTTIEEIVVDKVGKIIKSEGNRVLVRTSDGIQQWVSGNDVRVIRKRQSE